MCVFMLISCKNYPRQEADHECDNFYYYLFFPIFWQYFTKM